MASAPHRAPPPGKTQVRRRFPVVALGLVSLVSLVLGTQPQVWPLLKEGYPAQTWPAPGSSAPVEGSEAGSAMLREDRPDRPLDPYLAELFETGGGRGFVVLHGGEVEVERYGPALDRTTKFNSFSLVKSLVGALVLKAVADGRIQSLEDPVSRYLPAVGNAAVQSITLRDLLTMRSGILFEASPVKSLSGGRQKDIEATVVNPFGPMSRLHALGFDAIAPALSADPAKRDTFSYQNVNTSILGEIVASAYNVPLPVLLSETIWKPAGAADALWRQATKGGVSAYCCLFATARDWALVASFLMRNGSADRPFLPERLWRAHFGMDLDREVRRKGSYGHHLWHDVLDREGEALQGQFEYMLGQGGQVVYMIPERDLVVVRFGERAQLLHSTLYAVWRTLFPQPGLPPQSLRQANP